MDIAKRYCNVEWGHGKLVDSARGTSIIGRACDQSRYHILLSF